MHLTKEQRDEIIEEVFEHFKCTYGPPCKLSLAPNVPEVEIDAFLSECQSKLLEWVAYVESVALYTRLNINGSDQ